MDYSVWIVWKEWKDKEHWMLKRKKKTNIIWKKERKKEKRKAVNASDTSLFP